MCPHSGFGIYLIWLKPWILRPNLKTFTKQNIDLFTGWGCLPKLKSNAIPQARPSRYWTPT